MLEFCKTRTKKSSPDLFIFYVVSAGHDILGLTRAGEKSKPHDYKQNTKRKDLSKTRVLTANSLNISDKKKQKKNISTFQKHPVEYQHP